MHTHRLSRVHTANVLTCTHTHRLTRVHTALVSRVQMD